MELKFEVEKYGNHSRTFHTNVTVGSEAIEHYATWMSTSWSDICDKQGTIVARTWSLGYYVSTVSIAYS